MIYYNRVFPYQQRRDGRLVGQFAEVFIESSNDLGGNRQFSTIDDVTNSVWVPHIEHGRIAIASDDDKVIGLACVEPLKLASADAYSYENSVFDYLRESNIIRQDLPAWFFAELEVLPDYRNRPENIGSSLIRYLLDDLRTRDVDGRYHSDEKYFILTRTFDSRSILIKDFKHEGFTFLDEIIQHIGSEKPADKIWGYNVVHPVFD